MITGKITGKFYMNFHLYPYKYCDNMSMAIGDLIEKMMRRCDDQDVRGIHSLIKHNFREVMSLFRL